MVKPKATREDVDAIVGQGLGEIDKSQHRILLGRGEELLLKIIPGFNTVSNEHIRKRNDDVFRRAEDLDEILVALALLEQHMMYGPTGRSEAAANIPGIILEDSVIEGESRGDKLSGVLESIGKLVEYLEREQGQTYDAFNVFARRKSEGRFEATIVSKSHKE